MAAVVPEQAALKRREVRQKDTGEDGRVRRRSRSAGTIRGRGSGTDLLFESASLVRCEARLLAIGSIVPSARGIRFEMCDNTTRKMRKLLLTFACVTVLHAARFDVTTPGKIVRVTDPQISPNGNFVYIVVSRANFNNDLWEPQLVRVDIATKSQQVMAAALRGISSPRFSPDGKMVAFLANVEGKPQVHIMPVDGGSMKQVTTSKVGVQHFRWRPDGKAFAYAALDEDQPKEGPEHFNRSFEIQNNDYLRRRLRSRRTYGWSRSTEPRAASLRARGPCRSPIRRGPRRHRSPGRRTENPSSS